MDEFSNKPISDNFMFGKVMQDPERCRQFLEQILDIKIHHVVILDKEKCIDEKFDGHSIRMDIYVDDGKTIYDCEMQATNEHNLPKRSRYYQGQIDINLLKPGEDYNNLKKSYVIFICTFDPFGKDRYIYSFENICTDDYDLRLEDETTKVFINTKGHLGDVTEGFKELMHFLDSSEIASYNNSLVSDMANALVDARNNREWRHDYMTLEMYGWEKYAKGHKDGVEEGRLEGIKEGREEGIEQGIEQGRLEELFDLVQDGILSKDQAAARLGMSVEEFDLASSKIVALATK